MVEVLSNPKFPFTVEPYINCLRRVILSFLLVVYWIPGRRGPGNIKEKIVRTRMSCQNMLPWSTHSRLTRVGELHLWLTNSRIAKATWYYRLSPFGSCAKVLHHHRMN